MVRLTLWCLGDGGSGVHNDCYCLQFTVRGGPKKGGPRQVVLPQLARFIWR